MDKATAAKQGIDYIGIVRLICSKQRDKHGDLRIQIHDPRGPVYEGKAGQSSLDALEGELECFLHAGFEIGSSRFRLLGKATKEEYEHQALKKAQEQLA